MAAADDEREGLSLLVQATADGRLLAPAIERLASAGAPVWLEGARRLAFELADLRSVLLLSRLERPEGGPWVDHGSLRNWFIERGAAGFDVYRDRSRGLARVLEQDQALLVDTAERLGLSPRSLFAEVASRLPPGERASLLTAMAEGRPAEAPLPSPGAPLAEAFEAWCQAAGVGRLRVLQHEVSGLEQQSLVVAAIDPDGVAVVYKRLPSPSGRLAHLLSDEAVSYESLSGLPFLPRACGVVTVAPGVRFLRLSWCWGEPLDDVLATPDGSRARALVAEIAAMLSALHQRGLLYRDLRPENVVVHPDGGRLVDLGSACPLSLSASPVFDPRFAPPEVLSSLSASPASDVYALGALAHLLLTGRLPHDLYPDSPPLTSPRSEALVRFGLPALTEPPPPAPADDGAARLVPRMLSRAPGQRPSLAEIEAAFAPHRKARLSLAPRSLRRPLEQGCVLFPARMGIPHRGHIDFLARLIELGYHARISLQKAYTRTADDPIDKHLVMKMVGRSLTRWGFHPSTFSFLFTPFFAKRAQHQMHFAMMPGREHVRAFASGNPEVHSLLEGLPALSQKTVFGIPGEPHQPLSWGSRLREAIRQGDRATFDDLAAPGVLDVLSWAELRASMAMPEIPFVRGQVRVSLCEGGSAVVAGRARRYVGPEESLVLLLRDAGHDARLDAPFERSPTLTLDGRERRLDFEGASARGDDVELSFSLS